MKAKSQISIISARVNFKIFIEVTYHIFQNVRKFYKHNLEDDTI